VNQHAVIYKHSHTLITLMFEIALVLKLSLYVVFFVLRQDKFCMKKHKKFNTGSISTQERFRAQELLECNSLGGGVKKFCIGSGASSSNGSQFEQSRDVDDYKNTLSFDVKNC
jgi:hypothetical protein